MKKEVLLTFVSILVLAGMFVIGYAEPAPAVQSETIELRFAHFLPPVSARHKREFVPWAKLIEERTGGKVKITIYPAGSLLKQKDIYDGVVSNIAQIGFADIEQAWGRFPLTEVVSLPMAPWDKNERAGDHLVHKLFEKGYIADDYKNVKVLALITAPPMVLSTAKKPVRTMKDLKGLKIGVGQKGLSAALEKMGASPANILAFNHYMSLQKRTIDATMFSWVGMAIFRLLEVTNYHTVASFSVGPLGIVMNKQTWEDLPPDVKEVINGVSGEWFSKFDADFSSGISAFMRKKTKSMPKHEIITLSPEEEAKWSAKSREVWDTWASDMEAKGLPGKKLIEVALQISKEYTNWTLK